MIAEQPKIASDPTKFAGRHAQTMPHIGTGPVGGCSDYYVCSSKLGLLGVAFVILKEKVGNSGGTVERETGGCDRFRLAPC